MTDKEAYELLTADSHGCREIKTIAARPEDNEPVLNGKWYRYTVDVYKGNVKVKTKMDQVLATVLALISLPFALWFGQVLDVDGFEFHQLALPLGLLFLSYGIVWTIAYVAGEKEQKAILSHIYSALKKEPAAHSLKTGMSTSFFTSIIGGLIGIAFLIAYFIAR